MLQLLKSITNHLELYLGKPTTADPSIQPATPIPNTKHTTKYLLINHAILNEDGNEAAQVLRQPLQEVPYIFDPCSWCLVAALIGFR